MAGKNPFQSRDMWRMAISQISMGATCLVSGLAIPIVCLAAYGNGRPLIRSTADAINISGLGLWVGIIIVLTGVIGLKARKQEKRSWTMGYVLMNILCAMLFLPLLHVLTLLVLTERDSYCSHDIDTETYRRYCIQAYTLTLNGINEVIASVQWIVCIAAAVLSYRSMSASSDGGSKAPAEVATVLPAKGYSEAAVRPTPLYTPVRRAGPPSTRGSAAPRDTHMYQADY